MFDTGSHTLPHKYPIPNDLMEGIDSFISVIKMPITISTKIILIKINNRLKMVSHFIWLYERSNLLFFTKLGFVCLKLPKAFYQPKIESLFRAKSRKLKAESVFTCISSFNFLLVALYFCFRL
jgi:hypothetical protein